MAATRFAISPSTKGMSGDVDVLVMSVVFVVSSDLSDFLADFFTLWKSQCSYALVNEQADFAAASIHAWWNFLAVFYVCAGAYLKL